MARESEARVDPYAGSDSGLAVGRSALQAAPPIRAKDLQAGPPSARSRDPEKEHEKPSHIPKTGEGPLVPAPDFAAARACRLQGTKRRAESDRQISWSDS